MKLKVDSVSVIVTEPETIVSNAVNTHYCYFEFDETWEEYKKKAEFKRGDILIEVLLKDNKCAIPWEVLRTRGFLKIGVFGVCGDKRRPTLWSENILISEGASEGDEEREPSKTLFQQVVEIMSETKSIAQSVRDDADNGLFKGETGDKGDAGSITFKPVTELPTENIDESVIYLVPIEGSEGENRFAEYVYIDGKWEVLGAISIQVDHSEYVKFTDLADNGKVGVIALSNSFCVQRNSSGSLMCRAISLEEYKKATTASFVSKGTLENIKYDYVKTGITTNTETLTDEEKASACDWLGAVKIPTSTGLILFNKNTGEISAAPIYQSAPSSGQIPRANSNGNIKTNAPQDDLDCANKKYAEDNFVPKVAYDSTDGALQGRVYIVDKNEVQTSKELRITAKADSIPLRNANGNFYVSEPLNQYECAPRSYVDKNKGTKLYRHEMVFPENSYRVMLVNTNANKMTTEEFITALTDSNTIARKIVCDALNDSMGWRDLVGMYGKTETQINVIYPTVDGAGKIGLTDDYLETNKDYEDTVTEL